MASLFDYRDFLAPWFCRFIKATNQCQNANTNDPRTD